MLVYLEVVYFQDLFLYLPYSDFNIGSYECYISDMPALIIDPNTLVYCSLRTGIYKFN